MSSTLISSIRRTHDTDSKAFIHAQISSEHVLESIASVTCEYFEREMERENEALRRLHSVSATSSRPRESVRNNNMNYSPGAMNLRNGLRAAAKSAMETASERLAGLLMFKLFSIVLLEVDVLLVLTL